VMTERQAPQSSARFPDDPVPYNAPAHPSAPTRNESKEPEPAYRKWI
jgi:hypothetical protein